MGKGFLADAMLGRLAKWLRVMGHDTLYRSRYGEGDLEGLMTGDRILVTRRADIHARFPGSVLLNADRLPDQLRQLRELGLIPPDRSGWFSRCLACNTLLERTDPENAREHVPDYVHYENKGAIRYCPSCKRYYWPGTHRKRMLAQLKSWGMAADTGEE